MHLSFSLARDYFWLSSILSWWCIYLFFLNRFVDLLLYFLKRYISLIVGAALWILIALMHTTLVHSRTLIYILSFFDKIWWVGLFEDSLSSLITIAEKKWAKNCNEILSMQKSVTCIEWRACLIFMYINIYVLVDECLFVACMHAFHLYKSKSRYINASDIYVFFYLLSIITKIKLLLI